LLGVRLGHTDNIALAAEGLEQADDLAEVTAGLTFARAKPRLETHVAYQAQGVFYDEASESSEVFNTLNATSQLALVLNRVFFDSFAVYDQTIVDATGKYSFNKLALTGNRTDVAILGGGPRVMLSIGESVTGEIRYGYTKINYDDVALEDTEEKVATFTLGNSTVRSGGSWAINYDNEHYDYDVSSSIEFQTFDVELGYWVSSGVRLYTRQGLESDYTLVVPSGLQGVGESPGLDQHYWYVGTDWHPNDRTTLKVQSGQRSYGEARTFQWSYRTSRGGFNIDYIEEPTTYLREQLHRVRRAGEFLPIDSLDGPRGSFFYLQKQMGIAFVLDRPRSGAGIRVFNERRFDIVEAVHDTSDETERYSGVELNLRWNFSTASSVAFLSQAARRRSTLNVIDDELRYMAFNFAHRVGRQGQFTLNIARETSDPSAASSQDPYEENQVIFGIQRTFGTPSRTRVPQRFNGYLNGTTGR